MYCWCISLWRFMFHFCKFIVVIPFFSSLSLAIIFRSFCFDMRIFMFVTVNLVNGSLFLGIMYNRSAQSHYYYIIDLFYLLFLFAVTARVCVCVCVCHVCTICIFDGPKTHLEFFSELRFSAI